MSDEAKAPQHEDRQGDGARKPYIPPRLKVHGDVDKLTQLVGGSPTDALAGSSL